LSFWDKNANLSYTDNYSSLLDKKLTNQRHSLLWLVNFLSQSVKLIVTFPMSFCDNFILVYAQREKIPSTAFLTTISLNRKCNIGLTSIKQTWVSWKCLKLLGKTQDMIRGKKRKWSIAIFIWPLIKFSQNAFSVQLSSTKIFELQASLEHLCPLLLLVVVCTTILRDIRRANLCRCSGVQTSMKWWVSKN